MPAETGTGRGGFLAEKEDRSWAARRRRIFLRGTTTPRERVRRNAARWTRCRRPAPTRCTKGRDGLSAAQRPVGDFHHRAGLDRQRPLRLGIGFLLGDAAVGSVLPP